MPAILGLCFLGGTRLYTFRYRLYLAAFVSVLNRTLNGHEGMLAGPDDKITFNASPFQRRNQKFIETS